jgi:hypothetical protein
MVTPVPRWLAGVESIQQGDTSDSMTDRPRFTLIGDTNVPVPDMSWIISRGWNPCPIDWQVGRHLSTVLPVLQCMTVLEKFHYGNTCIPVAGRSKVNSRVCHADRQLLLYNMVTLVSHWLTGLESLQDGYNSVPVMDKSRDTSKFWH